jgi:hypothetical protein
MLQEEVLAEAIMMIPNTTQRLSYALEQLLEVKVRLQVSLGFKAPHCDWLPFLLFPPSFEPNLHFTQDEAESTQSETEEWSNALIVIEAAQKLLEV